MVYTCAVQFKTETPYFYSTYDEENEALQFMERTASGKKKVIVFGSGPIRIGQGIEFDYCSVHCVWTLKEMGYHKGMVSMQGLGYKEILSYLDGTWSLEEAIYVLKRDTRHFAKRQITWFKRERQVEWFDKQDFGYDAQAILDAMLASLREKKIIM